MAQRSKRRRKLTRRLAQSWGDPRPGAILSLSIVRIAGGRSEEFAYVNHSIRPGPDREGNLRSLIVFHLVPVKVGTVPYDIDEFDAPGGEDDVSDLEVARARALSASDGVEGDGGKSALRMLYRRSAAVQRYVLLRANGRCESCLQPAPFTRKNGTPYLEPHHTTRVSDRGPDHPRFVAAVCPSCHREIHHGMNGDEKSAALIEYLRGIESAV